MSSLIQPLPLRLFSQMEYYIPLLNDLPIDQTSSFLHLISLARKVAKCNLFEHSEKYFLPSSWNTNVDLFRDALLKIEDNFFSQSRILPEGSPYTQNSITKHSPCPLCWWPMTQCHCMSWNLNLPQWFIELNQMGSNIISNQSKPICDILLFHPSEFTSPTNTGKLIPFSHPTIVTLFPTAIDQDSHLLQHLLLSQSSFGLLSPQPDSIKISLSNPSQINSKLPHFPDNFILIESSWQPAKKLRKQILQMKSTFPLNTFEFSDIPHSSISTMRRQTTKDRVTTVEAYLLLESTRNQIHPAPNDQLIQLGRNFQGHLHDFLEKQTISGHKSADRIHHGKELLKNFPTMYPQTNRSP